MKWLLIEVTNQTLTTPGYVFLLLCTYFLFVYFIKNNVILIYIYIVFGFGFLSIQLS